MLRNELLIRYGKFLKLIYNKTNHTSEKNKLAEFINHIRTNPMGGLFRGSMYQQLPGTNFEGENLLTLQSTLNKFMTDFEKDLDLYKELYGAEFFPVDNLTKAASTVSGMRFIGELRGHHLPNRHALNAIALLHPVTDNLLDGGHFPKKSLEKLTRLLQGETISASTKEERVIFGLVENIFSAFPADKHPQLHWALNALHREQIRSVAQKETSLSLNELLDISFRKGGLSMVVAAYINQGNLTGQEFEYYFKQVGIFQLGDDFADIYEDMKDGIDTIWTREMKKNGTLTKPLNKFLATQDSFLSNSKHLLSTMPMGEKIAQFLNVGIYSTTLEALTRYPAGKDPEVAKIFKGRLFTTYSSMIDLYKSLGSKIDKLRPGEGVSECLILSLKSTRPSGPIP